MKLYIKNMVCNRCIFVVQNEIDKIGLEINNITLGEVTLKEGLTSEQKKMLTTVFSPWVSN